MPVQGISYGGDVTLCVIYGLLYKSKNELMTIFKQLSLAFLVLLCSSSAFTQESLTTAQWQEDLTYLKETVHKDYSFLFKKITAEKWDAAAAAFYDKIPTMQDHEVKVGLSRMVSLFKYGHTQVPFSTVASQGVLPVNLYHFEDGVFVEGATKENTAIIGARVLKIGTIPVLQAIEKVRAVVPVENESYLKAYGMRFLTVPAVLHAQGVIPTYSTAVTLTLEKDGKQFTHTLNTIPLDRLSRDYGFTIPSEQWESGRAQDTTPFYLKHLNDKLYYFEMIPGTKTLYVRQSSVFHDDEETLQDFYKRLFEFIDTTDVQKLVYDVRLNGGGNNYNNKPLIKGLMARPKINSRGKFFYIIGRNTFSACQNLTNEIEQYTEAIIVGEPTAENINFYGDTRRVTLPNSGLNAYLSFAWWQDRSQWDNKDWTIPHLAVAMTSEQYFTNQDPVLDVALNYTEKGAILNPMDYLTELFTAGKFAEVKSVGIQVAKDPKYKYYNFEDEFGTAGYRLFSGGNKEGGLFILELVAEMYPASMGALYSLASAQEEMKQTDKAIANYTKLIKQDPTNELVPTAKKKLAGLQKQ